MKQIISIPSLAMAWEIPLRKLQSFAARVFHTEALAIRAADLAKPEKWAGETSMGKQREAPFRSGLGHSQAMRAVSRFLAGLLLAVTALPALADTLVVGNKAEDTVSFIDLGTGVEGGRVDTGRAPHEVAISPDGSQAAVVAYGGSTIDVFNVADARRVSRIDISPNAGPHGIVWLRSGLIVASAERSRSVVIIDPRNGTFDTVATDQDGSHMLAVSRDQRTAFVTNILSGTVSVIDLRRKRKKGDIRVGGNPEGLAITPDGKQLWVGDNSGGRLRVVDVKTRRVIDTLATDPVPIRVAISPDGRTAVTSHIGGGVLNVFDVATRKRTRVIDVSKEAAAVQVTILYSADGKRVYAAETGRNAVAEVDMETGKVLRRLQTGKGGDGLGIAPVTLTAITGNSAAD